MCPVIPWLCRASRCRPQSVIRYPCLGGPVVIYILEDNLDRIQQFRTTAAVVAPDLPLRIWHSAHAMTADLVDELEHASLISLDHDLNRPPDEEDPGTGYEVASLLGELIPCCPVIIHTSNGERGTWMAGALSHGGWQFERVYPFGDDWIAKDWAAAVRRQLGRQG
jgi:hypothetical protein